MRSGGPIPPNKLKDVEPIVEALSTDPEQRLDEITSVIVVAEAADEFPQHIVQKIIELPADKRKLLMDVVSSLKDYGLGGGYYYLSPWVLHYWIDHLSVWNKGISVIRNSLSHWSHYRVVWCHGYE